MAKLNYNNGVTSVILRVKLLDSASATGAGKTALDHTAAGLIISTIADNEASATVYTAAGSTVETITTLGTFAAPTATKCRFKKIDDTNHPGLYEIQIADARWAVSNAKSIIVTVLATGVVPVDAEIQLSVVPADVDTIKTQTVTCAAGVTVSPFVGSTGAAVNGTNANTLSSHDPGEVIMGATDLGTGSGFTSLAPASTALSTAQWTNTLATNLGTLASHDPGGALASATSQTTINNNVLLTATQISLDALVATVGVAGAGLTAADDAVLAAIAALNNLSSAGAQAAAAAALTAYGAATATNVTSATSPLATAASLASLVTTVGVAGLGLSAIPKTGFKLASDGLDLVIPADPDTTIPVLGTSNIVTWQGYFGACSVNEWQADSTEARLRNTDDNADLSNFPHSDDGSTFTSEKAQ